MKRVLMAVLLVLFSFSCGRGGVNSPQIEGFNASDSLSVIPIEVQGSADLSVTSEYEANEVVLHLRAENANALRGVAVNIQLPSKDYALKRVEYSEFLGSPESVISFSTDPVDGILPLAVMQVPLSEAEGVDGSGEIARVYLVKTEGAISRSVSLAPGGDKNKVTDLTAIPTGVENEYTFTWKEKNHGDYNNSGKVEISDITPLAENFMKRRSDFTVDKQEYFDILDGDGNDVINIGDITPLAQQFFSECSGYNFYIDDTVNEVAFVARPAEYDRASRVLYTYGPTVISGEHEFYVAPVDRSGVAGVLSVKATISTGGGPPSAPTGVTAQVGQFVGIGTIIVRWGSNTEPDLAGYRVYRREFGDPSFGSPISVRGAGEVSYADTGLPPDTTYEYGVTAFNTQGEESGLSEVVSATPYYPAGPVAPSINVTGDGLPEGVIDVSWTYGGSLEHLQYYELERKAEGEADFTLIASPSKDATTYRDTGLTVGTLYTYRMLAVDEWDRRSEYSEEKSDTPGEQTAVPPTITSLTTDRYTYGPEGGTGTLTATADQPDVTYSWETTAGSISGSGSRVTFTPPAGGAQKITVTCTVTNAAGSDSETIDLVTTNLNAIAPAPLFTQYSYKQQAMYPFENYINRERVITLNFWAYWCGPCLAEFPFMGTLITKYSSNGYDHIGVHIDVRELTWEEIEDWYTTYNGGALTNWTDWYRDGAGGWDSPVFVAYRAISGYPAGIPQTYLIDRDGEIRFTFYGSITGPNETIYENNVRQLLGLPPL